MGAVEHLPGHGFARFEVEGGSQGQGDVGIHLHGSALTPDTLQAGDVMIFKILHIYVIA